MKDETMVAMPPTASSPAPPSSVRAAYLPSGDRSAAAATSMAAATSSSAVARRQATLKANKMAKLFPDGVRSKDGVPLSLDTLLASHELVGIYWAALKDSNSRYATPRIIEFYKQLRDSGRRFEIIYISGDETEEDSRLNYESMPWPHTPFNPAVSAVLMRELWVFSPPRMLLCDSSGEVVSREGVSLILAFPDKYPWPHRDNLVRKCAFFCLLAAAAAGILYALLIYAAL